MTSALLNLSRKEVNKVKLVNRSLLNKYSYSYSKLIVNKTLFFCFRTLPGGARHLLVSRTGSWEWGWDAASLAALRTARTGTKGAKGVGTMNITTRESKF